MGVFISKNMTNNFLLDEDLRSLSTDPKYTGYSSNDVLVETYNGNTFFSVLEAIEAGKAKEYFISTVYGNNLTFDELYQYNRDWDRAGAIVVAEEAQQQTSGVAQGNQEPVQNTTQTAEKKEEPISIEQLKNKLANEPDFETIRDTYEKYRKDLQDTVDKMNRASAEEKGKFAVIVQQLKQGLRFIKEYMVRFANKAREQFSNKPKGYYQTLSNMDSINSLEKQKKELEDAKTKREKEQAAAKAANSNNNTVQQSSTVTNHPSTPTPGTTKPDGTVTQGGGGNSWNDTASWLRGMIDQTNQRFGGKQAYGQQITII